MPCIEVLGMPAPPNYPLSNPRYHLFETLRPLIEPHWGGSRMIPGSEAHPWGSGATLCAGNPRAGVASADQVLQGSRWERSWRSDLKSPKKLHILYRLYGIWNIWYMAIYIYICMAYGIYLGPQGGSYIPTFGSIHVL